MATSKPDTGILSWQRSISVFIPALNEEKNLEPMVARLIEALTVTVEDYEIIIVDDGSSDGTGAVADGLAAENSAIRALHNSRNMGLGYCFAQGCREARKNFFVYIPGDNTWPYRSFVELSATLDAPTSLRHMRSILTFARSVAASFRASTQKCSTCSSPAICSTSTASPSIRSNFCGEIQQPRSDSAFRPRSC